VRLARQALDRRRQTQDGTPTWSSKAQEVKKQLVQSHGDDPDGVVRNAAEVFNAGVQRAAIVREAYRARHGFAATCGRQCLCCARTLSWSARWLLCRQVPALLMLQVQLARWCARRCRRGSRRLQADDTTAKQSLIETSFISSDPASSSENRASLQGHSRSLELSSTWSSASGCRSLQPLESELLSPEEGAHESCRSPSPQDGNALSATPAWAPTGGQAEASSVAGPGGSLVLKVTPTVVTEGLAEAPDITAPGEPDAHGVAEQCRPAAPDALSSGALPRQRQGDMAEAVVLGGPAIPGAQGAGAVPQQPCVLDPHSRCILDAVYAKATGGH